MIVSLIVGQVPAVIINIKIKFNIKVKYKV